MGLGKIESKEQGRIAEARVNAEELAQRVVVQFTAPLPHRGDIADELAQTRVQVGVNFARRARLFEMRKKQPA